MSIADYVRHLSRDEIRLFLPLRQKLCAFIAEPTRQNYDSLLKVLIYGDEPIEYVPASCILSDVNMVAFACAIIDRMNEANM